MSDVDAYFERGIPLTTGGRPFVPKERIKKNPKPKVNVKHLQKQNAVLKSELAEMMASFKLRWNADMRATERWRKAGADRDLTLPDHADLVIFLLKRLEATEKTNKVLREKVRKLREARHALRMVVIKDED